MKFSQKPENLIYRDLIGLEVYVKNKNPKINCEFRYAGRVIDETYNLLISSIEEDPKKYDVNQKKFIKKNYVFRFKLPTESEIITIEIDGSKIQKLPENRIKSLRKKNRRR